MLLRTEGLDRVRKALRSAVQGDASRGVNKTNLHAQPLPRLDFIQEGVDLLFLFQRMEPAIDVVAQQLALRFPQSLLANDLGAHAFEGAVLTRRSLLGVGGMVNRTRAPVARDQQVGLAASLRKLQLQLLQRRLQRFHLDSMIRDLLVEALRELLEAHS